MIPVTTDYKSLAVLNDYNKNDWNDYPALKTLFLKMLLDNQKSSEDDEDDDDDASRVLITDSFFISCINCTTFHITKNLKVL